MNENNPMGASTAEKPAEAKPNEENISPQRKRASMWDQGAPTAPPAKQDRDEPEKDKTPAATAKAPVAGPVASRSLPIMINTRPAMKRYQDAEGGKKDRDKRDKDDDDDDE